jgi:hypothetical protein
MAEAPQINTVKGLFSEKVFKIPDYQRSYAWEREHRVDFWNDVMDSLDTDVQHYWGTITLQKTSDKEEDKSTLSQFTVYKVVDGQQRLTTMALFILALCRVRDHRQPLWREYIKSGDIYRIELGGLNRGFFRKLIDGEKVPAKPTLKTNRLLKDALDYFEMQIEAYANNGGDLDELAMCFTGRSRALEFPVEDEKMAIRAFQSLNDRGKDLTLLDKAKSFLMFYSSRYLNDELNYTVNEAFGQVFRYYDFIVSGGEKAQVAYIINPRYRFSEDEVLRFFYHYFARYAIEEYSLSDLAYNYRITTEGVFKRFLKPACQSLQRDNSDALGEFITDFLDNFVRFVKGFKDLVDKADPINSPSPYRRLFSFLGLSATVYPLVLSLETEGLLSGNGQLLSLVEALDVRVYKVRGTNPRADLYKKAISRIKLRSSTRASRIRSFAKDFMDDAEFRVYLTRRMHKNPATKYILWEFEKYQSSSFDEWNFDLYAGSDGVQIEHILPAEPVFDFPAYGFEDKPDYQNTIHRLGNLTLLEESINKRIGNRTPKGKTEAGGYLDSAVPGTKKLGHQIEVDNVGFGKKDVEDRTEQIVEFSLQRWSLQS